MQESRTYNLFTTTTKTATGVSTQMVNGVETGYIVLPRPAVAATVILNITTASGTIKATLQRGIRGASGTNGLPTDTARNDFIWFDYASFTSTTSAGKRILPIVYTSTTSDSFMTSTSAMVSNSQLGGSIGTVFRGSVQISGASPTFTFDMPVEFEF